MLTRIEVRNEATGAVIEAKLTEGVFSIVHSSQEMHRCFFGKLADGDDRVVLSIPKGWAYGVTVNVPRDEFMVTVAMPVPDYTMLAKEYGITAQSLQVFMAYAKDAPNWSGAPLIGGNVGGGQEERGNLTQLKRAKLITTAVDDDRKDLAWLYFSKRGLELAAKLGIFTGAH
jgi:hypothetical protein